jgi:hypothetical protein
MGIELGNATSGGSRGWAVPRVPARHGPTPCRRALTWTSQMARRINSINTAIIVAILISFSSVLSRSGHCGRFLAIGTLHRACHQTFDLAAGAAIRHVLGSLRRAGDDGRPMAPAPPIG